MINAHRRTEWAKSTRSMAAYALILVLTAALQLGFGQSAGQQRLPSITPGNLLGHIRALASDEFVGRGPGSEGETRTIEYLVQAFAAAQVGPGSTDGTYLQRVPLSVVRSEGEASFYNTAGRSVVVDRNSMMLYSYGPSGAIEVPRKPFIFAGYGVSADTSGWDDYKGVDVRDKVVLLLANDSNSKLPPIAPLHRHYYTNRFVKMEEAARRGAAAVILVRPPTESDTGWQAVMNGHRELATARGFDHQHAVVEGAIRAPALNALLAHTNTTYEALAVAAAKHGFRAFPLPLTVAFRLHRSEQRLTSHNVIARIPGADPKLRKEHVIYTAHWDALGRDTSLQGDQIYNGALDDAGGTAQLLEIARAFASAGTRPRRSILFIATTAEEKGLIGSRYYVARPAVALKDTVAVINLDGIMPFGMPADMVSFGGQTSLDTDLEQIAKARGRTFSVIDSPLFYLSDQGPFATAGVPAIFPGSGVLPLDANKIIQGRIAKAGKCVHQPCDEVQADWDLSGGAEDAVIWLELGYRVAQSDQRPQWNQDSLWRNVGRR